MRREQVMRMLENYRRCAARRECLGLEIPLAEEQLRREREQAVADAALPGHAVDTPRGNGPGDPTARVAVSFASGYQPHYIREMEGDLSRLRDELRECDTVCRCVDAWRGALSDRERWVLDRHVIGGEMYADLLDDFAQAFPATVIQSPDGLKKLSLRAVGKVCDAAGAGGGGIRAFF